MRECQFYGCFTGEITDPPILAPSASIFILFMEGRTGVRRGRLSNYLDIPPIYKIFLTRLNGAYLFNIAIFGLYGCAGLTPTLTASRLLPPDSALTNVGVQEYELKLSGLYQQNKKRLSEKRARSCTRRIPNTTRIPKPI